MLKPILLAATAAATFAAVPASAAQIILSAPSIIGESGSFNASFAADNIVDQQIGAVLESFYDGSYWLNPEGRSPSFITIDLGAAYKLGAIELFNSRNLGDRATDAFQIRASNSVTAATGAGHSGQTLDGTIATLVAGRLLLDNPGTNPAILTAQRFAANDQQTAFRYLEFRPLTAIGEAYNNLGYGLNEIRVFEAEAPVTPAVPEPATWAMLLGGFGLIGGALRRRATPVLA